MWVAFHLERAMSGTPFVRVLALAAMVSLCGFAAAETPAAAADKITSLPGLTSPLPFNMYSGYVTVNASHGRALFYWFVESANNPSTDPVLVWMQGGPGCSSLFGLTAENGPIKPAEDGNMQPNPYSWNRFANVLYIDSPAGVGFSYSNTSSDYTTDNTKTAHDDWVFMQRWVERFPEFADNKLWITGESYGGDYVPDLVNQILLNGGGLKSALEGFIIGNPVLSCPEWEATANTIQVELFYWHALIPYSAYLNWKSSGCAVPNANPSKTCVDLLNEITDMVGPFDSDNLYTDLVSGNATLGIGPTPDHTISELLTAYLNRPDVQSAIHARPTSWCACCSEPGQPGGKCELNYTNAFPDMMPYYNRFFEIAPQLRIMIYSGDAQLCLSTLKRPLQTPWTRWIMDQQTAGYYEVYDRYTYATVKGAGHEVPMYQPREAFHLVSSFIAGTFGKSNDV